MQPGKLWGMRRLADAGGRFKMLAVDQRPPIKNLIMDKLGEDRPCGSCEFRYCCSSCRFLEPASHCNYSIEESLWR